MIGRKKLSAKEVVVVLTLLGVILFCVLIAGWNLGYKGVSLNTFKHTGKNRQDVNRVYNLIANEFYGDVDLNKSSELIIGQLVESLNDSYSYYLTRNEYKKFKREEQGDSVECRIIDKDIGYMKIYQFGQNFREEFANIVQELERFTSKKVIIDLRNNIGGDVDMAIFLADQFINKGILMREKGKKIKQEKIYQASSKALFVDYQVIILANSSTASSAEMLVAAILDNQRGKVVGEKTKGKGMIQHIFELKDGSAVQLTTGEWLTPQGYSIQGEGIEPDYYVLEQVNQASDLILEAALELL